MYKVNLTIVSLLTGEVLAEYDGISPEEAEYHIWQYTTQAEIAENYLEDYADLRDTQMSALNRNIQ